MISVMQCGPEHLNILKKQCFNYEEYTATYLHWCDDLMWYMYVTCNVSVLSMKRSWRFSAFTPL